MATKKTAKKRTAKKRFEPSAFHIVPKSQSGIEVKLELPDGTDTGETLTVRGADSVEFRKAQAASNRRGMDLLRDKKKLNPDDLAIKQQDSITELISSLVCGWSFESECTKENVIELFKNAPQIQELVDQAAGDRRNFFVSPLTS